MALRIADIDRVAAAFWSLGGEAVDLGVARGCRRPGTGPTTPECFLHRVRPGSPAELADLVDAAMSWCRRLVIDEGTPAWVPAWLVARDWTLVHQLQLVLPVDAEVSVTGSPIPLRPLAASDWPRIHAMLRVDHAEEDERAGIATRPRARTDDALTVRRALAAHADYRVAGDVGAGAAVGFVCGWADDRGVGIVEDVFVDPGHRRRGIASGLVAAAVADARVRGAGPVVIAADPLDHPKHLYQQLGFVAFAVTRTAVAPTAGGW